MSSWCRRCCRFYIHNKVKSSYMMIKPYSCYYTYITRNITTALYERLSFKYRCSNSSSNNNKRDDDINNNNSLPPLLVNLLNLWTVPYTYYFSFNFPFIFLLFSLLSSTFFSYLRDVMRYMYTKCVILVQHTYMYM